MSYAFYKILHLSALFISAMSLGGLLAFYSFRMDAGERLPRLRSLLLNIHGASLFAAFVAGFGLTAKLNIDMPYPFWIYLKLLIFLLIGGAPFFLKKYASAGAMSEGDKAKKAWLRPLLALALLAALFILASWAGVSK